VRVALIADLHGNLAALDAVLAELERDRFDELVCLGDVAVGPQAAAIVERVAELGCKVVLGNWDAWFLDGIPMLDGEVGRRLTEMAVWWSQQLSEDHRERLRAFRQAHRLELGGGNSLLCFHGSPRSYDDLILAETTDAELEAMLAGSTESVLAGGHTHLPLVRRHRGALVVNPGSVGLPFRQEPGVVRVARWAEYALVDADDDALTVELRRTRYDVDAYLELARASGVPHSEWWVGCWRD
jgi:putative phosphoesterase